MILYVKKPRFWRRSCDSSKAVATGRRYSPKLINAPEYFWSMRMYTSYLCVCTVLHAISYHYRYVIIIIKCNMIYGLIVFHDFWVNMFSRCFPGWFGQLWQVGCQMGCTFCATGTLPIVGASRKQIEMIEVVVPCLSGRELSYPLVMVIFHGDFYREFTI